ncbi:flagellar protein FlgN [Sansalvadorimonas sp. 2012CJ34-2]|uniref:Flagellar protein FlgN n=1 Tax=Parendozoicomonas callyspongiae TaxID=2942213 RepID=A0ABT0PFE9_9GAMM|nr:flagellar protein FlgN [Sansalvadorimonas sp. 2012CJ34-2]MCL6270109.1 flagellar protein FlgN [Sansalvadorimonas sp. 2012CJ34-2]
MPARIIASIASDLNDLNKLKPLLEQQTDSLRSRNMDAIPVLAQSISNLVQKLDRNNLKRGEVLVSLGFTADREGMHGFLEQHPEVNEDWVRMARLAKECQSTNAVNGQLLQMQQELTETMLKRLNRDVDNVGYAKDGTDGRLGESTSLGYA